MNQSNQTESEETQNDEVVGSAIKWSLGVFLALVAAGILIWLLTRKPPEVVVEKAGPTELPTERVKPKLEIPEVLFSTKLVNPQQTVTLRFTAPSKTGDYPFVCTFPGHWSIMNGTMKVVSGKPL